MQSHICANDEGISNSHEYNISREHHLYSYQNTTQFHHFQKLYDFSFRLLHNSTLPFKGRNIPFVMPLVNT